MTEVDALQETLAAEHAAVLVLAELGGRVSTSTAPGAATLLRSAYEAHRARRDALVAQISAQGVTPVGAAPGYAVPSDNRSAGHLLAVAARTETRCAQAYAEQVAATTGRARQWAVDALVESARRSLSLGGAPSAYPGAPELG